MARATQFAHVRDFETMGFLFNCSQIFTSQQYAFRSVFELILLGPACPPDSGQILSTVITTEL